MLVSVSWDSWTTKGLMSGQKAEISFLLLHAIINIESLNVLEDSEKDFNSEHNLLKSEV